VYTKNYMKLWASKLRKSARALIIHDGRILVMQRKRFSMRSGEWIEYYSIPGGGIERGEAPEEAVVRELREEMGVDIRVINQVAHRRSKHFEHFIYSAEMVDPTQQPKRHSTGTMNPISLFLYGLMSVHSQKKIFVITAII
jgi:ADP-ribose pyrophosphatase YjhB (NUDIX family)